MSLAWGVQISREAGEATQFFLYAVPIISPLRVRRHGHTNSRGARGAAASGGNRRRVRRLTRWRSDAEAWWCVDSHGGHGESTRWGRCCGRKGEADMCMVSESP